MKAPKWMKNEVPESWLSHDSRIKPYVWNHRVLGIGSTVVGLLFMLFLLTSNRGQIIEDWLRGYTSSLFVLWILYFYLIGFAWTLISLPFSIGHHWIERQFKLSKQGYLSWTWDQVKGLLVGGVLGIIMLGLVFLSQQMSSDYWWAISAFFMVLFTILLVQLAPVIFIPLFFKLKPMSDSPLKERLLALSVKFGIEVKDVYHLGLGAKTEKGNAAVAGLGKTKKILIGDTLYERFSEDEVEAVFAHELGHQVHNDLWKGIGVSTIFVFISFFLAWWISENYVCHWFDTIVFYPFGMLLFFIVFSLVQYPMGFVQILWSRARERMADGFAAKTIGVGAPLADALERLTFQNYGSFCPHPLIEFFKYSHPAPWRRIVTLRNQLPR